MKNTKKEYCYLFIIAVIIFVGIHIITNLGDTHYKGGIWTEDGYMTYRVEKAIYQGNGEFKTLSDDNIWGVLDTDYKVGKSYKLYMQDNCTPEYKYDDIIIKAR